MIEVLDKLITELEDMRNAVQQEALEKDESCPSYEMLDAWFASRSRGILVGKERAYAEIQQKLVNLYYELEAKEAE